MSSIAGRIDTEEETLSGWKKVASEFLASSRASPPLHVASEDWSSAENTVLVEYVCFMEILMCGQIIPAKKRKGNDQC